MQLLATGPCYHGTDRIGKLIVLKYFSPTFTLFEPCGAVFLIKSKIHLRENSSNECFKTLSHCFRVYSLSGFKGLVFFVAALAEVQVTVVSVLNLPRQGFPATCPIGRCCVCSPLLFASEILCDSPTYNKQRMNEMSLSRWPCCPETQNAR